MVFEQFTGSMPWSLVERDLTVPPQTRLLQIQVVRQASMRFDNKVGGTAWIDDLRLEPLNSRHRFDSFARGDKEGKHLSDGTITSP